MARVSLHRVGVDHRLWGGSREWRPPPGSAAGKRSAAAPPATAARGGGARAGPSAGVRADDASRLGGRRSRPHSSWVLSGREVRRAAGRRAEPLQVEARPSARRGSGGARRVERPL